MDIFDTLHECLPGWTLTFAVLEGVMGFCDTDTKTIWVDIRLDRRQRRSTVAHEAMHAIRGDSTDDPELEQRAQIEAARLLIPIEALTLATMRGRGIDDVLHFLGVDNATLRVRLEHITPDELRLVHKARGTDQAPELPPPPPAAPQSLAVVISQFREARQWVPQTQ